MNQRSLWVQKPSGLAARVLTSGASGLSSDCSDSSQMPQPDFGTWVEESFRQDYVTGEPNAEDVNQESEELRLGRAMVNLLLYRPEVDQPTDEDLEEGLSYSFPD